MSLFVKVCEALCKQATIDRRERPVVLDHDGDSQTSLAVSLMSRVPLWTNGCVSRTSAL